MKTNNKTLSQRIWFGIKSGWEMPILPDHIIKLERENIYIKILKIIFFIIKNKIIKDLLTF